MSLKITKSSYVSYGDLQQQNIPVFATRPCKMLGSRKM